MARAGGHRRGLEDDGVTTGRQPNCHLLIEDPTRSLEEERGRGKHCYNIHDNKLSVLQLWSSWDNKDSRFMCHEAFGFVVSSFSNNDLFSGCSWSNWWPWRGNSFQERMLILECFRIVLSPSDTFVFFMCNQQQSKDAEFNDFFPQKEKKQYLLPILVLSVSLWFVIRCDWFTLNSCSNLLLLRCLKIIQTVWDMTCLEAAGDLLGTELFNVLEKCVSHWE